MTIASIDDPGTIEVLPPRRPVQSEAIGQLMAHAEAMSAAKQLADALCSSELVPATYRGKPGNGAAAILYGAELGLNPIQSLQQIFVVHGSPAIYARTAVALLKRNGIVVETVSSTNEAVTVRAIDPRTSQVEQSTWDIPRAELAGYTSNKKYQTDPQAMLYAKAAMEVCRKIAPDVLLGIPYSREELEMEQQPTRVRSERGGRGVEGLRQAIGASPQAAAEPPPAAAAPPAEPAKPAGAMSDAARRKWLNRMFQLLGAADCSDREDQLIILNDLTARMGRQEPLEHRDSLTDDELKSVVNELNRLDKAGELPQKVTDVLQAYIAGLADEPAATETATPEGN